jgi:TolB-like protein/DNA-binding winged helix-turn-helix (wHTH) protein/Flp pilus assembly protein TadD
MQADESPAERFRFGTFEADLRTGELTKNGKRLTLQDQPFQLLALLLEKPGELVTREELRSRLWPATTVDFDHGLNKAISKIRDALGDSAQHPRFVETVARRGYRFLADVTAVHGGQTKALAEGLHLDHLDSRAVTATQLGEQVRTPMRMLVGFGVALALVASLSWPFLIRDNSLRAIRSLAVLPLDNLSGDPAQDYFAEGMTDELINYLGKSRTLRVISRTSAMTYKNVHKTLPQIAGELKVDAVVEGSVLRSDDRVRITVQLIHVPDEMRLWAQTYDENVRDTLALQSRVSNDIAYQVQATLLGPTPEKARTVNQEAYDDYLRGRYFWNKRSQDGLKKSIEYFSRAIDKDPNYAEAYAGLADSYALSGDWEYGLLSPRDAFSKAKAAATRALELDDSLGEAHASLAFLLDLYGWDWQGAETEYKRAIELDPGYATAHHWYAWHLITTRRNSEGLFELRKAESLDPLSLIIGADLADALCIAHRYDEAIQQAQKTLEMDPHFAVAHYQLGQALGQKHMYDQAILEFKTAIELSGHNAAFDSNLAYVYAVSGRKEDAMKVVLSLEADRVQYPSAAASIGLIYAGLGDGDQSMAWLEKAYEERFNPSILVRPGFDPLRSDARFQDLWHRIGLP